MKEADIITAQFQAQVESAKVAEGIRTAVDEQTVGVETPLKQVISDHSHQQEKRQAAVEGDETTAVTDGEQDRETWKYPKQNSFRLLACYFGFILFGMSDASIGVLVPSLESYYGINSNIMGLAFLSPFVGYLVACVVNDRLHLLIGRWGTSVLATCCQLTCYVICICKPPYPLFVIAYAICGFGNGSLEAGWNTYVGNLQRGNELLGILHGCYGLGGILSPTIFTAIISHGVSWNICYALMIGMVCISVTLSSTCFKGDTAKDYREKLNIGEHETHSFRDTVKLPLTWIFSAILFMYVGGEVTLGGWITSYMIENRNGSRNSMGYVTTGFWVGLTVGRLVLGFVTGYFKHEQILSLIYMVGAVAFVLIFWLVNSIVGSAVAVGFVGFFMGPIFPTLMVVFFGKVPRRLHVSGAGFVASFGGVGAAILPWITGVMASEVGTKSMAPFIFAMLCTMIVLWIVMMRFF